MKLPEPRETRKIGVDMPWWVLLLETIAFILGAICIGLLVR